MPGHWNGAMLSLIGEFVPYILASHVILKSVANRGLGSWNIALWVAVSFVLLEKRQFIPTLIKYGSNASKPH